ncbi:MAG TPA: hypothetical protein VML75_00970 [Kofleriaceae bacterium]|nr:hypothetical protein [Kofleriaceae bacterium]
MAMSTLRFRGYSEFRRATMRMTGAGALAAMTVSLLAGTATAPVAVGVIAISVAIAMLGSPFASADDLRWYRIGSGVALMALAAVLGYHALAQIALASELAAVPPWMTAALGGAAFGSIASLGLVSRHLVLARDPMTEAYRQVSASTEGDVRALVERAHTLWIETSTRLPADDEHRATLRQGVQRLFDVAARWSATRADRDRVTHAGALEARLAELERTIAATEDGLAQEEYRQARAGVAEQLRYLAEIRTRRERVVARLHTYLTAMERLRLALLNRDTAGASLAAGAAIPAIAEVQALGREVDASSDALEPAAA